MSIEQRLSEISERFGTGGRSALTARELIANDVADVVFLVTSGGVGGLQYNTDEARRAELQASADAIEMPEFAQWLRAVFRCSTNQDERRLDRAFDAIEEAVYNRLDLFLSESTPAAR